jgi:PAS domain S-box-containing protein
MRPLSIAARLYLLIALSTIALVVVIVAALEGSGKMVAAGHKLHDRGVVIVEETSRLALLFEDQQQLVGRAPGEIDRNLMRGYRARFDNLSKQLFDELIRMAPLADALGESSASRLTALFKEYRQLASRVFDFAEDFVQDKASDILNGPLSHIAGQIDAVIDQLMKAASSAADAEVQALSHTRDRMIWTIVGVSGLGVMTFNGLGIYVARRLTRQLGHIIAEMKALSAGDLDDQLAAGREPDELGAMVRAVEVFRYEMIASRQMAAEVRRSHEHLARAQQIAGVGSVEQDINTRRLNWSAEACRMFGVNQDEVQDSVEYFYGFIHPDDREKVRTAASQLSSGIAPPPLEYRIIRRDGAVRVLYRESEILCDETEHPLHRIVTFKDITEVREAQERQKELERQLLHSQKLEALGTLAGGVAHDLNNTLVPIVALSKLMLLDLPEDNPTRGDVEIVVHASERARDLVKQILAFSRKQDLVKQSVDLARVAREALQMLRASLPSTIEIVEQIGEVSLVFGDAGELHQVIVNLVTNAAQAIGDGVGRIRVWLYETSPQQSSAGTESGSRVCLAISDTGRGMDKATIERIFEPFFTTKGVGEGSGLGLSVVHGILTRHGGNITVRSNPGEGSEFTLSLPAEPQRKATTPLHTMAA